MDIVGSVLGLFLLSPLFLLIAALIKCVSRGPVFLGQERMGRGGKRFVCWKFRTMKVDADTSVHRDHVHSLIKSGQDEGHEKPLMKLDSDSDARIIPFGRLLRQSGLDELPQLINVLRGEMSLVGPRPCFPYEAEVYLPWHRQRFDGVPGLTGLWQVNGKNKTTFTEMMRLDIAYEQRRSFLLDFKIVVKTPAVIIDQVIEGGRVPRVAICHWCSQRDSCTEVKPFGPWCWTWR